MCVCVCVCVLHIYTYIYKYIYLYTHIYMMPFDLIAYMYPRQIFGQIWQRFKIQFGRDPLKNDEKIHFVSNNNKISDRFRSDLRNSW